MKNFFGGLTLMKIVARIDSFDPFRKKFIVWAEKDEIISPHRFQGAKVWYTKKGKVYAVSVPRWKKAAVGGDIDPEMCIVDRKEKSRKHEIPWRWSTDPA